MGNLLEKLLYLSVSFAAFTFGGLCLTVMLWMIKCWGI